MAEEKDGDWQTIGEAAGRVVEGLAETRARTDSRAEIKVDPANENAILDAVAAFLSAAGWGRVVLGGCVIERPLFDYPLNHQFVVRFLGMPPNTGER